MQLNAKQTEHPSDIAVPAGYMSHVHWAVESLWKVDHSKVLDCVSESLSEIATLLKLPEPDPSDPIKDDQIVLLKTNEGFMITYGYDPTQLNQLCCTQACSYGVVNRQEGALPLVVMWFLSRALNAANLGNVVFTGDLNVNVDTTQLRHFSDLKHWIEAFGESYDAWHEVAQRLGLFPSVLQSPDPGGDVGFYF